MDEYAVRAALQRYLDCSAAADEDAAHEIYHPGAVLEFPQSGERFEGVANFREWRRRDPAKGQFQIGRGRGRGDGWAGGLEARDDGGAGEYRGGNPQVPGGHGFPE